MAELHAKTERNKRKNTQKILLDKWNHLFWGISATEKIFWWRLVVETGKSFHKSLGGGKGVLKKLEKYIEWKLNNYWIRLSYDMKNYAEFGGCYPPKPKNLLDLHISYQAQPH